MRIAVYSPRNLPHSLRLYTENVTRELAALGAAIVPFAADVPLPGDVDIYWDPRAAGAALPFWKLNFAKKPLFVTLHGVAPLSLPSRELYTSLKSQLAGQARSLKYLLGWRVMARRCAAIIAVSQFAKTDISRHLGIREELIRPVYHGTDHEFFKPSAAAQQVEPYFLHLSSYQPKKNVKAIISAYQRLPKERRPKLLLVLTSGRLDIEPIEGLEIRHTSLQTEQIAGLYREALGFIFPSYHESFGLPILEAMACGCPVITSNGNGCAEVAGDAALLVNPRAVDELAAAMSRVAADRALRESLIARGLARARAFTWQKSAEEHLTIFQQVLGARNS